MIGNSNNMDFAMADHAAHTSASASSSSTAPAFVVPPVATTANTTHATAVRVRVLLPTGEYLLVQPRMWNEPEVR